jgi:hypothetical protein
MGTLLHLEPQPRFPYDDLTESNAEFLQLILANDEIASRGHAEAENARSVFKIGHQILLRAGQRLDYESSQGEAMDKGTAMFEVMSAMVNVAPAASSQFKVRDIGAALEGVFDEEWVRNYFIDSYDCFRHENPLAADVVRSASRLSSSMAEYAVLGAAISRHFEIDTIEAA